MYRFALFYNVIFVSTGIADLPAGAPCHRRLAHGGSPSGRTRNAEFYRSKTEKRRERNVRGVFPFYLLFNFATYL